MLLCRSIKGWGKSPAVSLVIACMFEICSGEFSRVHQSAPLRRWGCVHAKSSTDPRGLSSLWLPLLPTLLEGMESSLLNYHRTLKAVKCYFNSMKWRRSVGSKKLFRDGDWNRRMGRRYHPLLCLKSHPVPRWEQSASSWYKQKEAIFRVCGNILSCDNASFLPSPEGSSMLAAVGYLDWVVVVITTAITSCVPSC